MSVASYGAVNTPCTQAISSEVVEAGDESFFTGESRFTPPPVLRSVLLNAYSMHMWQILANAL